MSDPLFPIPIVRQHNKISRDDYGEAWVVIYGIETKVPSIAAAKALLANQDKVREEIRAGLDALGIRDWAVTETITLEDGTTAEVQLLPPGEQGASILQINMSPTSENITKATALTEAAERALALAANPPKKPTFWQKFLRAFRRKKGRR